MLERLTKRKGGLVYYTKDNQDIASVNMENFDIYKVLQRLAEYEDAAVVASASHKKYKPTYWDINERMTEKYDAREYKIRLSERQITVEQIVYHIAQLENEYEQQKQRQKNCPLCKLIEMNSCGFKDMPILNEIVLTFHLMNETTISFESPIKICPLCGRKLV